MNTDSELPLIKNVPIKIPANSKNGQNINLTIINSHITNKCLDLETVTNFQDLLKKRQKFIKIIQDLTNKDSVENRDPKDTLSLSSSQIGFTSDKIIKVKLAPKRAKIISTRREDFRDFQPSIEHRIGIINIKEEMEPIFEKENDEEIKRVSEEEKSYENNIQNDRNNIVMISSNPKRSDEENNENDNPYERNNAVMISSNKRSDEEHSPIFQEHNEIPKMSSAHKNYDPPSVIYNDESEVENFKTQSRFNQYKMNLHYNEGRMIEKNENKIKSSGKYPKVQIQKVSEKSTPYLETLYKGKEYKFCLLMKPYNYNVAFQLSRYPGRHKTVFFRYPPICEEIRPEINIETCNQEEMGNFYLSFSISETTTFYECVLKALKYNGFRFELSSNWNILWTGLQKTFALQNLSLHQRTNHFPGTYQVARKDNLWRNINRLRTIHNYEYNIAPITYVLPEDLNAFLSDQKEKKTGRFWIMKPEAQSCGRGIKILNEKSFLSYTSGYIISRYIQNPHLIHGYKYDLRIYILVTSFDPLIVYMFNNGIARFATEKYSLYKGGINNKSIHLTNYSINKNSVKYKENNLDKKDLLNNLNPELVSKWDFEMLRKKYELLDINFDEILLMIKDIVIKCLITIEPHIFNQTKKKNMNRKHCFDLFGMDILIDQNLRPWLLEVNASPSLECNAKLDKRIKTLLLCDVFNLIGIIPFDKYTNNSILEKYKTNFQQKPLCTEGEGLTPEEINMLYEFEEEQDRCGHFKRIFPLEENCEYLSKFFECDRRNNNILWEYINSKSSIQDFIKFNSIKPIPNDKATKKK